MPLALKIILGVFGYLLVGCLSTFLVPIWINLWEMANLEFSGWEYDIDIALSLFDWSDDEDFLVCFIYYLFWPIIFVVALVIWPIVLFFNVTKLCFYFLQILKKRMKKNYKLKKNMFEK